MMNAAAAVYAAPQLARSALAGVRTLRSAGSLGEAVAVTRQAVGARVDRAAAAIKGAAQGIRNAPSSLMARVRPSELGELRWGGAAPQGARGSTVGELRASGQADAHHIIQDAAVRDVPGYKTNAAPGIRLDGPSTTPGSPHYNATQVQRTAGVGGTYGAERQAGCMALAAAGCSPAEITDAISRADDYFMGELGLTLDSPLRIPGNRRIP